MWWGGGDEGEGGGTTALRARMGRTASPKNSPGVTMTRVLGPYTDTDVFIQSSFS